MYSVSPTANRPTATIRMSIPSSSATSPKVKRGWPVCRSIPTIPIRSPMASDVIPRVADDPSTADTMTKHRIISEKYPAASTSSAAATTSGATKATPSVPMVPATKDPMADVASAAPARPDRAMRLPSSAVTTVALSPGVFSRIDVVDPPYIAP